MQTLGDTWLEEMVRWTIQDQVSLPYLLWRERIRPGSFGLDQLDNEMVAIMAHAEELRNFRTTVLALETDVIRLEDEVMWLQRSRDQLEHELQRLKSRRSVRVALRASQSLRPFFRLIRPQSERPENEL
jgi:hypothetical protein